MLRKILIGLAILVVALCVVIAMQPSEFRVSRSGIIAAPPSAVFPQVNNLHNWSAWSPWAKMDPEAKNSFSGPEAGEGAAFSWDGEKTGAGTMTITESQPDQLVRMRLDFVKPFEGTSATEFTFLPEGEGTRVTWTMTGTNNFVGKAIGLVMSCDKMVGGQFEEGLANMRAVAEATTH